MEHPPDEHRVIKMTGEKDLYSYRGFAQPMRRVFDRLTMAIQRLEAELEEAKAFGKRADKAYQDAKDTIHALKMQMS